MAIMRDTLSSDEITSIQSYQMDTLLGDPVHLRDFTKSPAAPHDQLQTPRRLPHQGRQTVLLIDGHLTGSSTGDITKPLDKHTSTTKEYDVYVVSFSRQTWGN